MESTDGCRTARKNKSCHPAWFPRGWEILCLIYQTFCARSQNSARRSGVSLVFPVLGHIVAASTGRIKRSCWGLEVVADSPVPSGMAKETRDPQVGCQVGILTGVCGQENKQHLCTMGNVGSFRTNVWQGDGARGVRVLHIEGRGGPIPDQQLRPLRARGTRCAPFLQPCMKPLPPRGGSKADGSFQACPGARGRERLCPIGGPPSLHWACFPSVQECTNPCCNPQNCTLKVGADCAHGDCCQSCKVSQPIRDHGGRRGLDKAAHTLEWSAAFRWLQHPQRALNLPKF